MKILRKMIAGDLAIVAELGIRSKASWGYDEDAMCTFSGELTHTEECLDAPVAAEVACDEDGEIVGYFTLRSHESEGTTELEHLFVDVDHFGRGIGSLLLEAAISSAKKTGVEELTIICDPNSTGFYQKHGATIIGEHESSISGRKIPILKIGISD